MKFFSSSSVASSIEAPVASPYVRAHFTVNGKTEATLKIAVVGIYELYINGRNITRGFLSPYRSNPNHFVFGDTYDLTPYLKTGDNVIGLRLGNGFSCSQAAVWNFDKLSWTHAPKVAITLKVGETDFEIDNLVFTESDITFDDFHYGEHIDANKTLQNWAEISYNDADWSPMLVCDSPKGQIVFEEYPAIRPLKTKKPVSVFKGEAGIIIDFGESGAGRYHLSVKGEKGKTIYVYAADALLEGKRLMNRNIIFDKDFDNRYRQCDWLTLSGNTDHFTTRFTSKGCRYLEIQGLTEEEAKSIEVEFEYMTSLPEARGHFACDNDKINYLQEITLRSDISNFYYYPYDCPQREKNGWTADAALSCEQLLLNFDCADQFKRWMRTIVAAQREDGAIPGIVPTDSWGFAWGAGPGWDIVLFEIPWRVYLYTGDTEILSIVSTAIEKYLAYMLTKRDEKGLFHYGLPDWLPVDQMTPLEVTDTMYCKEIATLAAKIFAVLGDHENSEKAKNIANSIKADFNKVYPEGDQVMDMTQAWLSMGIYYDIFDRNGSPTYEDYNSPLGLLARKLDISTNHMNHGALANRCIYRVLAENGMVDRAVTMLTTDYPSLYAMHHDAGATTLFEAIYPKGIQIDNLPAHYFRKWDSFNHHFYGDISAFFYRHLAGIQIESVDNIVFAPSFAEEVRHVKADYQTKHGVFAVEIEHDVRTAKAIITIPKGITATVKAPMGYKVTKQERKEKLIVSFARESV